MHIIGMDLEVFIKVCRGFYETRRETPSIFHDALQMNRICRKERTILTLTIRRLPAQAKHLEVMVIAWFITGCFRKLFFSLLGAFM